MRFLSGFLPLLFVSNVVFAAQNAKVIAEYAPIYESPDETAVVLKNAEKGQVIRVSSESKAGWFKVQLQDPEAGAEFGWIKTNDVMTSTQASELTETKHEPFPEDSHTSIVDTFWFVRGLLGSVYVKPAKLQATINLTKQTITSNVYGLELGYGFSPRWAIVARGEKHSLSQTVISDPDTLSYSASGWIVALMGEYSFIRFYPWRVGVALGGGLSMATKAQNLLFDNAAYASESLKIPVGLGKVVARYNVTKNFAFMLELGYRYLLKRNVELGFSTIDLNLSGFLIDGGLQYDF